MNLKYNYFCKGCYGAREILPNKKLYQNSFLLVAYCEAYHLLGKDF